MVSKTMKKVSMKVCRAVSEQMLQGIEILEEMKTKRRIETKVRL
jgi:hypothetical protein